MKRKIKKKIDLILFTGKGGFSHFVPIIKILDQQKYQI